MRWTKKLARAPSRRGRAPRSSEFLATNHFEKSSYDDRENGIQKIIGRIQNHTRKSTKISNLLDARSSDAYRAFQHEEAGTMATSLGDGSAQVVTQQHDVMAVRHPTAHGAFCRVFVDGVSAGTASYRKGRLSMTGEYPESSYQAVARAVALVLGQ